MKTVTVKMMVMVTTMEEGLDTHHLIRRTLYAFGEFV